MSIAPPGPRKLFAVAAADGSVVFAWRGYDSDDEGAHIAVVNALGNISVSDTHVDIGSDVGRQFPHALTPTSDGAIWLSLFDEASGLDNSGSGVTAVRLVPPSSGLDENTSRLFDLLANDSDPENGALTLQSIGTPVVSGPDGVDLGLPTLSIENNKLRVEPGTAFDGLALGQSATISVSYTVRNAGGATDTATAQIVVHGRNDAPVAGDNAFMTGTYYSALKSSLTFDDYDPDNVPAGTDPFTIVSANFEEGDPVGPDPENGGTITVDGTFGRLVIYPSGGTSSYFTTMSAGDFEYITSDSDESLPPELATARATILSGHQGTDVFTYTIRDSHGATDTAQITMTVDGPKVHYTVSDAFGFSYPVEIMMSDLGTADLSFLPDNDYSPTVFVLTNAAADRQFIVHGSGFTYGEDGLTGGIITSFEIKDLSGAHIATLSLRIDAVDARAASEAAAAGDLSAFNLLSENWIYHFDGNDGADTFAGGGRNDSLYGNGGADILDGACGSNELTGGADADVFVIGDGATSNIVYDFSHSDHDRIDLSGVSSVTCFGDLTSHMQEYDYGGGNTGTSISLPGAGWLDLKGIALEDLTALDFVFAGTALLSVRSDAGFSADAVYQSMFEAMATEEFGSTGFFAQATGSGFSFFIHGYGFMYEEAIDGLDVTGGTITSIDIVDANRHPIATLTGLNISNDDLGAAVDLYGPGPSHDSSLLDSLFGSLAWSAVGGDGSDILPNGTQGDVLTGGAGADTFLFAGGNDIVTDFATGIDHDRIDVTGFNIAEFEELDIVEDPSNSANTVIDFGNGNAITLLNVNHTSLTQSHFVFV